MPIFCYVFGGLGGSSSEQTSVNELLRTIVTFSHHTQEVVTNNPQGAVDLSQTRHLKSEARILREPLDESDACRHLMRI